MNIVVQNAVVLVASGTTKRTARAHPLLNAARVVEAIAAVAGVSNVELILDTFADIDRGYFARSGLVDRRYNPKVGSRAVASLLRAIGLGEWQLVEDVKENQDLILAMEDGEGGRLSLRTRDGCKLPYLEQRTAGDATRTIELAQQALSPIDRARQRA